MAQRRELQAALEGLLGSREVYFQPPATIQMSYPAIVYSRAAILADHADNNPYYLRKRYSVTVIDRNPDSVLPDKLAEWPMCRHDRHFKVDNLNHDVFTLYF